jgi:hypothetical protein
MLLVIGKSWLLIPIACWRKTFRMTRHLCLAFASVEGWPAGETLAKIAGGLPLGIAAKDLLANNISNRECFRLFWWRWKISPESSSVS